MESDLISSGIVCLRRVPSVCIRLVSSCYVTVHDFGEGIMKGDHGLFYLMVILM